MKKHIRISYTSANLAERGQMEQALQAVLGNYRPPTWQMLLGRKFHECFEAEIKITGRMPTLFNSANIEGDLQTETYRRTQLADNIVHSGVCDVDILKNGKTIGIVEFKTTGANASISSYQKTAQPAGYAFGTTAKWIWTLLYDYFLGQTSVALRYYDKEYFNFSVEYFVHWALEIEQYAKSTGRECYRDA